MGRLTNLLERRLTSRRYSVQLSNYKLPTYQHDQCERSLYMHLFTMKKNDLTLILILLIAIEAFCLMLATLAPDVSISETFSLTFKSNDNNAAKQQEYQTTLNKAHDDYNEDTTQKRYFYYLQSMAQGANFDLDLEPPIRWPINETIGLRQDKIFSEYLTKPLSKLNKDFNFLIQMEFRLKIWRPAMRFRREDDTPKHGSESELSLEETFQLGYQLEVSLEPVINESALSTSSKDNNKWHKNTFNVNFECKISTTTTTSVANNKPKQNELINNNYGDDDDDDESDQKKERDDCDGSDDDDDAQCGGGGKKSKETNARQPLSSLIKCQAPQLWIKQKIDDSNKLRYKLKISISGLRVQTNTSNRVIVHSIGPMELKFNYINSSFTQLANLIYLFYVLLSLSVASSFILCLSEHKYNLWSVEQKWTALMLLLLIGSNRPMSTLQLLMSGTSTDGSSSSSSPPLPFNEIANYTEFDSIKLMSPQLTTTTAGNGDGTHTSNRLEEPADEFLFGPSAPLLYSNFELVDSILSLNFLCGLLLSWTCFAHSIRQISRPFWSFYSLKLSLVLSLWLLATSAILYDFGRLKTQIKLVQTIATVFYLGLLVYFAQLVYQFCLSAIELRSMSYFTIRFRVQVILCAWFLINYASIFLMAPKGHTMEVNNRTSVIERRSLKIDEAADSLRQSLLDTRAQFLRNDDLNPSINQSNEESKSLGPSYQISKKLNTFKGANDKSSSSSSSSFKENRFAQQQQQQQDDDDEVTKKGSFFQLKFQNVAKVSDKGEEEVKSSPTNKNDFQEEDVRADFLKVLAIFPQYHLFDSAFSLLGYVFLNNLYVITCAYFYWPMVRRNSIPCKLLPTSLQTGVPTTTATTMMVPRPVEAAAAAMTTTTALKGIELESTTTNLVATN